MSEISEIGKMISILVGVILYFCTWEWAVEHQIDCNRNAYWEVIVANIFILLHIIALIVWFVWSWLH